MDYLQLHFRSVWTYRSIEYLKEFVRHVTASDMEDLYGKECKFRVLLNVVGKAKEASFIVNVLADMYFRQRTSWIPS
jgi:hypothetical protein